MIPGRRRRVGGDGCSASEGEKPDQDSDGQQHHHGGRRDDQQIRSVLARVAGRRRGGPGRRRATGRVVGAADRAAGISGAGIGAAGIVGSGIGGGAGIDGMGACGGRTGRTWFGDLRRGRSGLRGARRTRTAERGRCGFTGLRQSWSGIVGPGDDRRRDGEALRRGRWGLGCNGLGPGRDGWSREWGWRSRGWNGWSPGWDRAVGTWARNRTRKSVGMMRTGHRAADIGCGRTRPHRQRWTVRRRNGPLVAPATVDPARLGGLVTGVCRGRIARGAITGHCGSQTFQSSPCFCRLMATRCGWSGVLVFSAVTSTTALLPPSSMRTALTDSTLVSSFLAFWVW